MCQIFVAFLPIKVINYNPESFNSCGPVKTGGKFNIKHVFSKHLILINHSIKKSFILQIPVFKS